MPSFVEIPLAVSDIATVSKMATNKIDKLLMVSDVNEN
jgi:hypothetical protein